MNKAEKKQLEIELESLICQEANIQGSIRKVKGKLDPDLKNGFYVTKLNIEVDEKTLVFHVYDGSCHCMTDDVFIEYPATKDKIVREVGFLFNSEYSKKVSFKKVPAQEVISCLKG